MSARRIMATSSPTEILELCEEIGAAGVWLRYNRSEDRLYHAPVGRATPELARRISAHRDALVEMMVEDEELRLTGVLQSERQVFEEFRKAALQPTTLKEGAA